jgi:predicted Rossmann fold flavoprotein
VARLRKFDVAVIGAGAAGLFCAAVAGRRGRRVLLLDHAEAPGKKILISGGGRCNFTNLNVAPENFLSGNPHFCKSALAGFSAQDFIGMVTARGIAFHEKHLGQLFCDGSAKEILAMLVDDATAAGVDIRLAHHIKSLTKPDDFQMETDHGTFTAGAVVLATGGLSIPKMGATGFAHDIARQFGLALTEIRPGLVPFTAGAPAAAWMSGLSGVAFDAVAACGKTAFREAALFTHRGLSGPALLQISSYWHEGQKITLDMLPGQDAFALLLDRKAARPKAELKTVLAEFLPARLAHAILQPPLGNHIIGTMPNAALKNTAALIHRFVFEPGGTEGYAKAEVTLGGIDTRELSSKTLEAVKIPGLYIIGEAVDVTSWLGGYNFQWAWSSGFAAGNAV